MSKINPKKPASKILSKEVEEDKNLDEVADRIINSMREEYKRMCKEGNKEYREIDFLYITSNF